MENKKRILFITDTFGYGGAEKQLAFVAEGLFNRGYVVGICNLNQGDRNEGKRHICSGVEMFEQGIANDSKIKYLIFCFKVAREFKPDIIVGFKELANFCAVIVGKLIRVPSIISERADPYRAYSNAGLNTRLILWIINHASRGVFQTEQAAQFYDKKLYKNRTIIPNPIFPSDNIPAINYSKLPRTVVSLGRIDNVQKRLDVMINAFAQFHLLYPDYHLKIYGNGPDEDLIRQWIAEKDLVGCVHLMGVSKKPMYDLSQEGIFLITSDFEGISNSLLEAMACGLPVVSTDHTPGGARLLINDLENGLLVPMGDVEAIFKALCHYVEDPLLAEKCGKNATKVLERFSASNILDMWEKCLEKTC